MDPRPLDDHRRHADLLGGALRLLVLALLLLGAGLVLRPFLPAILWSVIIVVATWPLFEGLIRRLHGRRRLATWLMSGSLLVVVLAPIGALLATFMARLPGMRELLLQWLAGPWPGPPGWLAKVPAGARLASEWQAATTRSAAEWNQWLAPWAGKAALWASARLGSLGELALQFVVTLVVVFVLYGQGEVLGRHAGAFARRIGGSRGVESLRIAAGAVRAIAAGVVLTALAESVLAGLALWAAGAEAVLLLTAAMFLLCVVQVGLLPVLVPAVIWLAVGDHVLAAVLLGLVALALSVGEGFMRMWLIGRGAQLPMMLILAGVFGGLLAFGIAGLFAGPILLAVVLRLLERWVADSHE